MKLAERQAGPHLGLR